MAALSAARRDAAGLFPSLPGRLTERRRSPQIPRRDHCGRIGLARSVMRMDQVEDDDSDYESENHGEDAITVACLAVARKLTFGGLYIAVSGYRTVRKPAQGAAGNQEYEDQSIGGRAHRNAFSRDVSSSADLGLHSIFAHQEPYRNRIAEAPVIAGSLQKNIA